MKLMKVKINKTKVKVNKTKNRIPTEVNRIEFLDVSDETDESKGK